MRITRNMINKDIRAKGDLFKIFLRFRSEGQLKFYTKITKMMRGRYAKVLKVKEKYVKRSTGTKLRLLICVS